MNLKQQSALPKPGVISPESSDLFHQRETAFTYSSKQWSRTQKILIVLLELCILLPISFFLCINGIGNGSFAAGDQTTHSLVVQDMVHSGHWWTPQLDGHFYSNKPPFKMWIAALTVKALGESNFSYRIVDGVTGVLLTFLLYWFATTLFSSRLVGMFSVFALLGSNMLFFGHGIRNATQDGMFLLLFTVAIILGWKCVEYARTQGSLLSKRLWVSAFFFGLTVGLSVLTKNIAGYLVFLVLGIYLLLSGYTRDVFRTAWKQALFAVLVSVFIPALYIVPHCIDVAGACHNMFIAEVYRRAMTGYHNVHHPWYYFKWLFRHRIAVPPELLVIGLTFGITRLFSARDRRYLLLLIWIIIPVLVFSIAKSKIFWYILPALPAMSILVGVTLKVALFFVLGKIRLFFLVGKIPVLRVALVSLLVLCGIVLLGYNLNAIKTRVLEKRPRTFTDSFVQASLQKQKAGQALEPILRYKPPRLSRDEEFYWAMLPSLDVSHVSEEDLSKALWSHDFLITNLTHFGQITRIRPVTGYAFLPIRHQRRQWIAVLSFVNDSTSSLFKPASRTIDLGAEDLEILYGSANRAVVDRRTTLVTKGPKTGVIIEADHAMRLLGTNINLELASLIPTKRGALNVDVFVNDLNVAKLENVQNGFQNLSFFIPPSAWQSRRNNVSFVSELQNGGQIEPREQVVLLDKMKISLHQVQETEPFAQNTAASKSTLSPDTH